MADIVLKLSPTGKKNIQRIAKMQKASEEEVARRALGLYTALADEAAKGTTIILKSGNSERPLRDLVS
jgi:hypothetical protein